MNDDKDAHTPVTLINYFANAFQLPNDTSLIFLKGIYQDKKRMSYGGYYYDRLKDEVSGQIMTIRVPEQIKAVLGQGQLYLFKGVLEKTIRPDGVIEPVFVAAELLSELVPRVNNSLEQRLTIQRQKARDGYKDLSNALKRKLSGSRKPQLILVHGATSIVMDDVYSALGTARQQYDIVERRTNMLDKDAIINTIKLNGKATDIDGLALVRGGGPGLEIFDHLDIAHSALTLPVPLITAIGHAQDVTLLEQLADKSFATPTALGTYLKEVAQEVVVQIEVKPEPAPQVEQSEPLLEQYQQQIRLLRWSIIGMGAFFIVVILLFVLGG